MAETLRTPRWAFALAVVLNVCPSSGDSAAVKGTRRPTGAEELRIPSDGWVLFLEDDATAGAPLWLDDDEEPVAPRIFTAR